MDLNQLRIRIDSIDQQITALIGERMKVVRQIGKYKKKNGIQITDTLREQAVIERVVSNGKKIGLSDKFIENLFKLIMVEAKKIQLSKITK